MNKNEIYTSLYQNTIPRTAVIAVLSLLKVKMDKAPTAQLQDMYARFRRDVMSEIKRYDNSTELLKSVENMRNCALSNRIKANSLKSKARYQLKKGNIQNARDLMEKSKPFADWSTKTNKQAKTVENVFLQTSLDGADLLQVALEYHANNDFYLIDIINPYCSIVLIRRAVDKYVKSHIQRYQTKNVLCDELPIKATYNIDNVVLDKLERKEKLQIALKMAENIDIRFCRALKDVFVGKSIEKACSAWNLPISSFYRYVKVLQRNFKNMSDK